MKVAQVTKYYPPHRGGMESQVQGIAESMGGGALVITSNPEVQNGVTVYRSTPVFTEFNAPFIPGMLVDLFRADYDLIHFHHPDPFTSVFVYLASILRGKPLVITYHADIIDKPGAGIYSIFLHALLRRAKKIIATTPQYVERSKILWEYRGKTVVIPNFVDTKQFYPKESKFKEKHGISDKMILFLGRLVPYKGVDVLIRAFLPLGGATLVIAGEGPLKQELMLLAEEEEGNVIFVNPDEEGLMELYNACDLFVLPSVTDQEAFGVTLLEAQACGKPVIGTAVGGVPHVVGYGQRPGGIVVPPKDVNTLSLALEFMLLKLDDKQFVDAVAHISQTRVKSMFDKEVVIKQVRELYDKCLGAD